MQNFKKLEIWQLSKSLTLDVYNCTKAFPKEERFGITNQIRRSAISISSNIAEGCGRNTKKDFANFIDIVMGSLFELESQLTISYELGYITSQMLNNFEEAIEKQRRKMINFLKTLRQFTLPITHDA